LCLTTSRLKEQILNTTANNAATMAPSAIASQLATSRQPETVAPPKLYPVKEAHFEGFVAPQPDGYRKAQQIGSDNVAIIIDNGTKGAADPHCLRSIGFVLTANI
jgi:actin-related protein 5